MGSWMCRTAARFCRRSKIETARAIPRDGLSVGDRVSNAGYDWSAAGENIAAGQPTIDVVMKAWFDSPGHCANIMSASYTELGTVSYAVSDSDYSIYWTQDFAKPRM
jgi:uncharacterized protein YkwD